MGRLTGKRAIVTGASQGIGAAIACAYACEGAKVLITYCHSHNRALEVAEYIREQGGEADIKAMDLMQSEDIVALVEYAKQWMGGIDVMVNNAGVDILTGLGRELSREEKLKGLLEGDLIGTMNACWSVLPIMREQGEGVILNMAWDLATHGFAGSNPQLFAAAKAGILGFSRSLAKSCVPEIRVNILSPGWIKTAFATQEIVADYYEARLKEIPMGRFGTPEEVAAVAVFLATDSAAYITGESFKINGGLV